MSFSTSSTSSPATETPPPKFPILGPHGELSQKYIRDTVLKDIFPVMLGDWFCLAFWALLMVLVYKWYERFWKRDHWLIKVAVAIILLNETTALSVSLFEVYELIIVHWNDLTFVFRLRWQSSLDQFFLAITTLVLHSYLIVRYFRISRNKWLSAIFVILMLANIGICLRLTVELLASPTFPPPPFEIIAPLVISWLVCSSVIDVSIAVALSYSVMRIRKTLKGVSTKALLKQMMIISFETGVVSSVLQIVALIAFLVQPYTSISRAIGLPLRTILALVFLFNLLVRSSLQKKHGQRKRSESKNGPSSPGGGTEVGNGLAIMSVGVVSQVIVRMDIDDRAVELDAAAKFYRNASLRRASEKNKRKETETQSQLSNRDFEGDDDDDDVFQDKSKRLKDGGGIRGRGEHVTFEIDRFGDLEKGDIGRTNRVS